MTLHRERLGGFVLIFLSFTNAQLLNYESGQILALRLRKARQVEDEASKSLAELYAEESGTNIPYTETYLQVQLDLQVQYYQTYKSGTLPHRPTMYTD